MAQRRILVIHCSATPPTMDIGIAEIRKWHLDRGFADVGYHYIIRRGGHVDHGRPEDKTPAAQRGFNEGTITICLVGGVDHENEPQDNFTQDQHEALKGLIRMIRADYDVLSILGHRDIPGVRKACPSFSVTDWLFRNYL